MELLLGYFNQYKKVAIAFSGGVDSSYLIHIAKSAGCDVRAYFIKSQFQPRFELDDAVRLAGNIGIPLAIGTLDVLADPDIAGNPSNRCYFCKSAIFTLIKKLAEEDGFPFLFDGSNADDDENDRAGMKALKELGVASPLRECGIRKTDIRRLSKQAGLFTHDKPSYACLATRIPAGTHITADLLERIEGAENILFGMGFSDFRVRLIPPDTAKLQILESEWDYAAGMRADILFELSRYFNSVVLDLTPRRFE